MSSRLVRSLGIVALLPLFGMVFWVAATVASSLPGLVALAVNVHGLGVVSYAADSSQRPAPLSPQLLEDAAGDASVGSTSHRLSPAATAAPTSAPTPVPVATPIIPLPKPTALPVPTPTPTPAPLPAPTPTPGPIPVPLRLRPRHLRLSPRPRRHRRPCYRCRRFLRRFRSCPRCFPAS